MGRGDGQVRARLLGVWGEWSSSHAEGRSLRFAMRDAPPSPAASTPARPHGAGEEVRRPAGPSSAPPRRLMEENSFGQKLLAEVVGTGFLVFIGVGSVPATLMLLGNHQFTMAELGMISFAFALMVIAMVYSIGHISGCHINPAVTVALALTGKFPWKDVPAYIGAQALGAVLGSLAILATLGMDGEGPWARRRCVRSRHGRVRAGDIRRGHRHSGSWCSPCSA